MMRLGVTLYDKSTLLIPIKAFVVSLPDFNVMQPCTHGDSYQEALDNAQDVIELLEDVYDQKGIALPVSNFVA